MTIQHRWDLMPAQAIALQKELAGQVDTSTPLDLDNLKMVAGVDVSVKNNVSRAAVVVLSYPAFEILEAVTATLPTKFPYIPGLLSFREGEVILAAHQQLKLIPDVYIFDGMGIAHPRRLGIAAHIGLWLDRPTVGCGKTHLYGKYTEPDLERGSTSPLLVHHKDHNEVIGMVVRTRTNVQPVYISPGNHATIETAVELILRCSTRYRLPEPIRAAHNTAGEF
ncbi:MAG: endonuclease V [Chloroflexi bacterium]|nr:endonuclease V [Chloroflexota bacterium]